MIHSVFVLPSAVEKVCEEPSQLTTSNIRGSENSFSKVSHWRRGTLWFIVITSGSTRSNGDVATGTFRLQIVDFDCRLVGNTSAKIEMASAIAKR